MSASGKISVPEGVVNWLFKVIQPIYDDGRRTFHDSLALLDKFHRLRPRTRVFTHPDGSPQLLLSIYGTVGDSLPLIMWIPNLYPVKPPFISIDLETFDVSTISSSLPVQAYIDSDGRIALPILDHWNPATMSLIAVVQELMGLLNEPSQDPVPSLPPKPDATQSPLKHTIPPLPPKPKSPHVQPPLPPPPPPATAFQCG